MAHALIDPTTSPPRVAFPTPYNAGADLLHRQLPARADKIAVRDDRTALSYAALRERADRAGNTLLALGLRPEERVLMVMIDTVDFPAVFLGDKLAKKVSMRLVHGVAAAIFAALGVLTLLNVGRPFLEVRAGAPAHVI